jgi:hypothetical protein
VLIWWRDLNQSDINGKNFAFEQIGYTGGKNRSVISISFIDGISIGISYKKGLDSKITLIFLKKNIAVIQQSPYMIYINIKKGLWILV